MKGQAKNTVIKLEGKIQDFPFENINNEPNSTKGIFIVDSIISNSFIEYGKGWPELNNFDFKIKVENNNIIFESIKGDLLNNNIKKMVAQISPSNIKDPIMDIKLILESPIPKIINAINKSPIKQVMKGIFDELNGEGNGELSVNLQIPLKDENNITFNGVYEFQNSSLINDNLGMPEITNIIGKVEFNQDDIKIKKRKHNYLEVQY